jgi:hypothetical protein
MIGNDELAIITVAWHFLDATVSKDLNETISGSFRPSGLHIKRAGD